MGRHSLAAQKRAAKKEGGQVAIGRDQLHPEELKLVVRQESILDVQMETFIRYANGDLVFAPGRRRDRD